MRDLYDSIQDLADDADRRPHSSDDHDPYGFAQTQLQTVPIASERRNPAFERVIEAQLLARGSMAGC